MAYVADPLDDNRPQDSEPARYAAQELRGIKTKLKEHETAVVTTLPAATGAAAGAAAAAQSTANTALANAATALAAGNTGIANAATAQAAADAAAALAAANAPTRSVSFTSAGAHSWVVPAGISSVVVAVTSGTTAKGWKYLLNFGGSGIGTHPEGRKSCGVYKLTVTTGEELTFTVGSGETLRADAAITYANGWLVTNTLPTESFIGFANSGLPDRESWAVAQTGVPLNDTVDAKRVDGKLRLAGHQTTGGATTVYGTMVAGQDGSVTIFY